MLREQHLSIFETMRDSLIDLTQQSERMTTSAAVVLSLQRAVDDLQLDMLELREEVLSQKQNIAMQEARHTAYALLRDVLMHFQSTFLAHFGCYTPFDSVRKHVRDGTPINFESFANFGLPDVAHFVFLFHLLDTLQADAHPLAPRRLETLTIACFDALPTTDEFNRTHIAFFLQKVQGAHANNTLIRPPRFNVGVACGNPGCGGTILHKCSACRTLHCESHNDGCMRPPLRPTKMEITCNCQPQAECKPAGLLCYHRDCNRAALYSAACCREPNGSRILYCSSTSTTCPKRRYAPRKVFERVRCANPACGAVGSMTR